VRVRRETEGRKLLLYDTPNNSHSVICDVPYFTGFLIFALPSYSIVPTVIDPLSNLY
jgi:hypothetical protein